MITLHTIVKNEERFIKSALSAALSSHEVTRALVWDTGSTDGTVKQILSIKDKRIEFQQKGRVDRSGLVQLRKEQLKMTETPWFLLVDGDEIWPEKNLRQLILTMKQCNNETIALVCRTRNLVGDLYHYLPESQGHYQIGPWTGHLNIRAIRTFPGLTVRGEYPNEWYEYEGKKIQESPVCLKQETPRRTSGSLLNKIEKVGPRRTSGSDLKRCLQFVDTWYLHATHVTRSGNWLSELSTIDRLKKQKWFYRLRGKKLLKMGESELPELLRKICQ